MKKFLFLLLSLVFLVSCEQKTQDEIRQEKIRNMSYGFEVVVIDSCEYLIKEKVDPLALKRGYGFMAHKGNCKFCEERRKNATGAKED